MIPYDAEKILPEEPDDDPKPISLRKHADVYECETELPAGYSLEDVEIEVDGDTLVIRPRPTASDATERRGSTPVAPDLAERGVYHEMHLPDGVDHEHLESKMSGPVLTVTLHNSDDASEQTGS